LPLEAYTGTDFGEFILANHVELGSWQSHCLNAEMLDILLGGFVRSFHCKFKFAGTFSGMY